MVETEPSVYSLNILDRYNSWGYLLGFIERLFEMILEISQLVEARREEEKVNSQYLRLSRTSMSRSLPGCRLRMHMKKAMKVFVPAKSAPEQPC